jgi:hypothetical protein
VGLVFLFWLRFALRSFALWRVFAIAPSLVSGWRAFSSFSLSVKYRLCPPRVKYRFTERMVQWFFNICVCSCIMCRCSASLSAGCPAVGIRSPYPAPCTMPTSTTRHSNRAHVRDSFDRNYRNVLLGRQAQAGSLLLTRALRRSTNTTRLQKSDMAKISKGVTLYTSGTWSFFNDCAVLCVTVCYFVLVRSDCVG